MYRSDGGCDIDMCAATEVRVIQDRMKEEESMLRADGKGIAGPWAGVEEDEEECFRAPCFGDTQVHKQRKRGYVALRVRRKKRIVRGLRRGFFLCGFRGASGDPMDAGDADKMCVGRVQMQVQVVCRRLALRNGGEFARGEKNRRGKSIGSIQIPWLRSSRRSRGDVTTDDHIKESLINPSNQP